MKSVADDLRDDLRRRVAAMTPAERIDLALRLGRGAVQAYAQTHGVSEGEARRVFARARRIGRVPSGCIDGLTT